jgi:UDP-3-O-[3-hydroxymyristoyl] glucosamine N-acyltransferase
MIHLKEKKWSIHCRLRQFIQKIIHPTAIISNWVEIGEGSIVGPGAILTTNIKIGDHAIINLGVTIGHDCLISNFFTAEPSVNISGNCKFNECVYLGTNSSVKENISIQNNVIVGMGGVVIKISKNLEHMLAIH